MCNASVATPEMQNIVDLLIGDIMTDDCDWSCLRNDAIEQVIGLHSQKTTYQYLIDGGYEFVQATPTGDGWFDVVFTKNGYNVILKTNESF